MEYEGVVEIMLTIYEYHCLYIASLIMNVTVHEMMKVVESKICR